MEKKNGKFATTYMTDIPEKLSVCRGIPMIQCSEKVLILFTLKLLKAEQNTHLKFKRMHKSKTVRAILRAYA